MKIEVTGEKCCGGEIGKIKWKQKGKTSTSSARDGNPAHQSADGNPAHQSAEIECSLNLIPEADNVQAR